MNYLTSIRRVGLALAISTVALPVIGNAQQDAQRRGPPPEALEACANLAEGAACSFTGRRGEATGSCIVIPEVENQLACAPEGGRDGRGSRNGEARPQRN